MTFFDFYSFVGIGIRFAILELKLTFANLLLKYRFVPSPKTEMGSIECVYKTVSMEPKNGVHIKAIPIESVIAQKARGF